jgi:hypothetical protein
VIDGIHFKFACEWAGANEFPMISFLGGTNTKLTIKNCTFENTGSHADGRFFCGSGSGGGTQTIENCEIKNFTSWLLLDATTNSGTATVKLDKFALTKSRIDNCMGSMSVRGMQADPNGDVEFSENIVYYGSNGQHSYFWAVFEANNSLRVVCEKNIVAGASKAGGANATRHFFQVWSRSARPWYVRYQENHISGFYTAIALAAVATFYSPDIYNPSYLLSIKANQISDLDYGASFVYDSTNKWASVLTYAPENVATYSLKPVSDFPSGLAVRG